VARAGLLGNRVLRLVRGKVGLNLLLGGLRYAAGQLRGREGKVGDLALLRNRGGVARGVLLEEGLQIAVTGVDGLAQIVGGKDGVVKLDFDGLLAVGVADFLLANGNAGSDERLHAPDYDIVLDALFKVLDGHVEAVGDEPGVLVIADELSVGEEDLAGGAVVQVLAHIVVRSLDAELLRFSEQDALLDKLLANLLLKEVKNHGIVSILRVALLQLLAGNLLHALLAHRDVRGQELAVPVGVDDGIGVRRCGTATGKAGDEVHAHGHRGSANDDDEERLGDAIVSLQETNHGWT